MSKYDVIIIGGGLSGLVAGVTAAKRGRKVLLLEKHATLGGLAAGFTRKGYYFDSGMSRCMAYIQPPLAEAGVKMDLLPHRTIWNVEGSWVAYGGLEEFFRGLEEAFPEERDGLRRLYENEVRPAEAILARFFGSMDPGGLLDKSLGMLRIIGALRNMKKNTSLRLAEGEVFGKYLDTSGRAYRFLIEREDEVDYRGEMDFFTKVGKLYTQTLNIYPSGGYQCLMDALGDALRARGGQVRTCAEVEKILIQDGQAVGVSLKTHAVHEDVYAQKVICCLDLRKALYRLVGEEYVGADLAERLGKSKLSRAIPMFYLGVTIPPEVVRQRFQGREEVFYYPESDPEPDAADFFRSHALVVHASCLHNPQHAPAGKTNLQVYLSCPPDGWMENWGLENGARGERYRQVKEAAIADLLSALEKLIPELRDRSLIEVCELGTPYTLERYTANTDGSCLGFRMDADFVNSKKMGAYFDRIPSVANLYFAGQQTGYPGGVLVATGSGKHAGKMV